MAFLLFDQYVCCVSGEANLAKKEKEFLQLWNLRTGKPLGPALAHDRPIHHVAFRPADHRVYSVIEAEKGGNRLLAWDVRTGVSVPTGVQTAPLVRMSASPDGRYLLEMGHGAAVSRQAKLWDLTSRKLLGTLEHTGNVLGLGFGNASQFALSLSAANESRNEARVWDLPAGKLRFPPIVVDGAIDQAKINSDDRRMMIVAGKKRIAFALDTGELLAQAVQDENYLNTAQRAFRERTRTYHNEPASKSFRVWVSDDASGQKMTPPFFLPTSIRNTALGSKVLLNICDDRTVWLWDVSADERRIGDILRHAELATGYTVDTSGNLVPARTGEWRANWQDLRSRFPERFARVSPKQVGTWHHEQLLASEAEDNFFASIWHLDRLIADSPNDPTLYFRRGLARDRVALAGTEEKILADYSRAIALGAKGADVFLKRGELRLIQQNWKEAFADLTEALKRGADPVLVLPKRGQALLNLEQWKAALVDLDKAIGFTPRVASIWQDRGIAQAGLGRWKEAIRDHEEAIRLGPDEFSAWDALGTAYGQLGRWNAAEVQFEKLIERGAPSWESWEALAWLKLRRGDVEGYRDLCTRLLAQGRQLNDPNAGSLVAWVCALTQADGMDLALPLRLIELARWKEPDKREHVQVLAAVVLRRGKYAEAIRLLNQSVAKHGKGGDGWDHLLLALAHARLGHAGEARQWLSKAETEAARRKELPGTQMASWTDRLGMQVLRREVVAVLNNGAKEE